MPLPTIVLKNAAAVDQTFTLASVNGDTVTYVRAGSSLLDIARLTIQIKSGKGANRVYGKLSVPSVGVNPSTGLPEVQWTEVGSNDLSSVLKASTTAAADFAAMWGSFQNHTAMQTPFKTGNFA